ncbi:MAG: hypothetical protein LKM31_14265 [Sphingobium sp.]|jgi:hypothetical protein|nr:hypothetical protein [Sphingobium sp.]MCI1756822.1 hypothetical protein [Sphingobium sp.]
MDMSFALNAPGSARLPRQAVSMDDIRAAATKRRALCGRVIAASFLRGQDDGLDLIHILACAIMLEGDGLIDTVALGGSFNPAVAHQLMVGKRR